MHLRQSLVLVVHQAPVTCFSICEVLEKQTDFIDRCRFAKSLEFVFVIYMSMIQSRNVSIKRNHYGRKEREKEERKRRTVYFEKHRWVTC